MPHRTHVSSFPSFKPTKDRELRRHHPERNAWLAADRSELWWQIVIMAVVVGGFVAGGVLIVLGLTR